MAVLFDLDGTLVDTAPDMADALNALLVEVGRPELPFDGIRPFVSTGAPGMIRQGFGDALADLEFETHRSRFLELYDGINGRSASLFDGYQQVLELLENADWPWGIVTNKPTWLSEPLVAKLGIAERLACLVCGDTLAQRKPHPDPLLHAADQVGVAAAQCVYIGDDARDMQAAQSAGMAGIVATYGYIPEDESPEQWPAAARIAKPEELIDVLGLH